MNKVKRWKIKDTSRMHHEAWNKGKKLHYEVWMKSQKGIHVSPKSEFKKGLVPWNKGKAGIYSDEYRNKIKLGRAKQIFTQETRKKMSDSHIGKKHWNWKGGVSKAPGYNAIYGRRYDLRKINALGSYTYIEWETLKAQYNWTCPACHKKEPLVKLTADHIIPITKGGSNNIENIQPLCANCNCRKYTKIIKYEY